jgi:hypothetical protein
MTERVSNSKSRTARPTSASWLKKELLKEGGRRLASEASVGSYPNSNKSWFIRQSKVK